MKPRIWTLLLALLAGNALPALASELAVGQAAPDFSVLSSAGKQVSLAQYRGHYVALEWTNPECPFVGKHYHSGNMQNLQKTFVDRGVVWLTIDSAAPGKQGNLSAAQATDLLQARHSTPTAFLLDSSGTVGHLYGAKTTPHMFLIDPRGKLVYAGGIDSIASVDTADVGRATPYFKNAVEHAIAGQAIDPNSTRPYGCSVKY
jgi:peroxiredoxin